MPIFLVIYSAVNWLAANIGDLHINFERTALEFIMLGRIPATEVYIQFEAIMIFMTCAALYLIMRILFTNPDPTA